MEKYVTKIYLAVLLIGIAYAVYAAFSFHNHIDTREENKEVVIWDDQMEMRQEGNVYYYSRILPSEHTNGKVIVYNTVHMYLEVFIDGHSVYALQGEKDRTVKTTGFYWNVIPLTADDAGKEIVFRETPVYGDGNPKGVFYYGAYWEIEHKILTERIARLVLSGMIALAGIVMLLYGLFVVKKGPEAETIMQFAIFAIMLGVWSVIETQIPDWLFPGSIIVVFLSHMTLMTMPVPFMLFLRSMYRNGGNRLWNLCCYLNCMIIVIRMILQIMGIYDLRETLLLTHICLLLFVAVIVGMTIQEMRADKPTRLVKINSICVMIILVSTILELAIYRFGNMSTPLGSIGFFIYIIVMGIVNVQRSHELIEQARESALYRKLAFTDELTGLSNRTAFREDLENRMTPEKAAGEEKILPTVIYMFDLNDLKKCNDTYGHDYGDHYIKMAADALKEVFAEDGKCYRIGGDEFCAWTPYISMDEINRKIQMLERDMQELNNRGFVVPVSISIGFAVYQEDVDGGGLYSTMKRADVMMYEKKQEYKRRNLKA